MMTREEELKILAEYLETTGATKLPKDTRGPSDIMFSVWKRPPPKKRGRKPKPKPAK
jgi:hypothetical protein